MFDNIKKLMELKKTMSEMKKRLDDMVIKVESPKKFFEVTLTGSQEVKEFKVLADLSTLKKMLKRIWRHFLIKPLKIPSRWQRRLWAAWQA